MPSAELQTLMSETSSNFQAFTSEEQPINMSMMEEYPEAMQRQHRLKYLVRRLNGQPNPVYPDAPTIAWVGKETIEFMEGAFSSQAVEYMQRLVLHEKAYFLWEYAFDSVTRRDWATIGGWFPDPTQQSGWSTNNTREFVSAYAHLKNPNEDMAESIAFYITNPDALRNRSMRKFDFIRDSARALIGTGRASYLKDTEIPRVVVQRAATFTLTETITLNASEAIINQPQISGLRVVNGTINDIARLSDTSFRLTLLRSCADTLSLEILPGFFQDTVLNSNETLSWKVTDPVTPAKPVLSANGSMSFCTGDSVTLIAQSAVTGALVWKRDGVLIPGQTGISYRTGVAGSYTVEVAAANGCRSASGDLVLTTNPAPRADFSITSPTQCLATNEFRFNSLSSISSGSVSLIWHFGDGKTSTTSAPAQRYTSSGNYQVKLIARSAPGCTDSISRQVTVLATPGATLQASPLRNIYPGLSTAIIATPSAAGNYAFQWHLNDVELIGETSPTLDSIGLKHPSGRYRLQIGYPLPLPSCAVQSPESIIGDSARARLFIYLTHPPAGSRRPYIALLKQVTSSG